MEINKYEEIKVKLEKLNEDKIQADTLLKASLKELKEQFNVETEEAAIELLKQLEESLNTVETSFNKNLLEIQQFMDIKDV